MDENYEYRRKVYYEDDEIDLYELWLTLKKRKWIVIITTFLFIILATIYAFFIAKPIYRSEAKILPISDYYSLVNGLNLPIGGKDKKLLAVLSSNTLKTKVIERLNLRDVLNKREILINISTDKKTGVIKISVDYPENPELAKVIVDTFLDEAQKMINKKSFSLAHRYKLYLEKQLYLVKRKIDLLEKIYIKYIKGEIKEVPYIFNMEEKDINKFSIDEATIESTQGKLNKLEKSLQKLDLANSLPEKKLNIERLNLQFSLLKNVFVSLYREYEIAKLQEKKETLAFDVIDKPYILKKPVKPKKKLILTVAGVSGLFLGIFLAFFVEWIENVKRKHTRKDNSLNSS